MSVFQTQGYLTIKLNTGIDISASTVNRILYKKPDGTSGYWTASSIENNTTLVYNLINTDLDQTGVWTFQAFVTIGGKNGYGDYVQKEIKPKLS